MASKNIRRVKAGKLGLADLQSGDTLYIIGLADFYTDVKYKQPEGYELGKVLRAPVVNSILEHFNPDGKTSVVTFRMAISGKTPDDLFTELLELENIGQSTAVLAVVAFLGKLPDLKEIYASAVHDAIFVHSGEHAMVDKWVEQYRPDMLSTVLREDVAAKCARKVSRFAMDEIPLKNPPDYLEVAKLALERNTHHENGFVMDEKLCHAEKGLRELMLRNLPVPVTRTPDENLTSWMSDDQKETFMGIINSDAGVNVLQGMPGTGKSAIIVALVRYYMEYGMVPLVTSFMNKACLNLQERMPEYCLESLYKTPGIPTIHSIFGKLTSMKEQKTFNWPLIIVDESSVISSELLAMLMTIHSYAPDSRFLFVGDKNQLPPVCAYGTPFHNIMRETNAFSKNVRKFYLTEFHRSSGRGIYELICKIRDAGKDSEITLELSPDVDLLKVGNIEGAKAIGKVMASHHKDDIRSLSAVCETNKLANAVNIGMCMGHLGLSEHELHTRKRNDDVILTPDIKGMRIVARESTSETKKINGRIAKNEFGTLIEYTADYAVVQLDIMNRVVRIDDPYLYLTMFDPGYASTVHKFQGSECSEILYFMKNGNVAREGTDGFYRSKELKYVGMSRAINRLTTVIIDPMTAKIKRVEKAELSVTPLATATMLF